MKRISMFLLLIGALFVGTAKAQAAVVYVGPGPYYRTYYRPYRRVYYRPYGYWGRPYRAVAVAPAPAYYYAPTPVVVAPPVAPAIAIGLGFRIR